MMGKFFGIIYIFFLVRILPFSILVTFQKFVTHWICCSFAQVFPETKRDLGVCVSTGYFSFVTFLLVKLVPILEFKAGIVAALALFLGLVIICSFLLFFIMPETKELSLEDIEDVITQGKFYRCLEILSCKNQQYIVND